MQKIGRNQKTKIENRRNKKRDKRAPENISAQVGSQPTAHPQNPEAVSAR
jgi:hypothetical protein